MSTMRVLGVVLTVVAMISVVPAQAANVVITDVSVSGGTVNGDYSVVLNNGAPGEGTAWNTGGSSTAWWNGNSQTLTATFDQEYILENIHYLSVDCNDHHRIQTSLDNINWTTLFDVYEGDGEIFPGMDTMSSYSGDGEYVAGIDFAPLSRSARYVRIFAPDGDSANAVGELQFLGISQASLVNVVGLDSSGTVNGDLAALINNCPAEGTEWNAGGTTSVWWSGTMPFLTLTLDQVYRLDDVFLSVDMNDDYLVETSLDNVNWTTLFAVNDTDGEGTWGLDTMTSYASDEEVAGMDFGSATARYVRVSATGGDGSYAVGEVRFMGVAIPEPNTFAIVGIGAALIFFRIRRNVGRKAAKHC